MDIHLAPRREHKSEHALENSGRPQFSIGGYHWKRSGRGSAFRRRKRSATRQNAECASRKHSNCRAATSKTPSQRPRSPDCRQDREISRINPARPPAVFSSGDGSTAIDPGLANRGLNRALNPARIFHRVARDSDLRIEAQHVPPLPLAPNREPRNHRRPTTRRELRKRQVRAGRHTKKRHKRAAVAPLNSDPPECPPARSRNA